MRTNAYAFEMFLIFGNLFHFLCELQNDWKFTVLRLMALFKNSPKVKLYIIVMRIWRKMSCKKNLNGTNILVRLKNVFMRFTYLTEHPHFIKIIHFFKMNNYQIWEQTLVHLRYFWFLEICFPLWFSYTARSSLCILLAFNQSLQDAFRQHFIRRHTLQTHFSSGVCFTEETGHEFSGYKQSSVELTTVYSSGVGLKKKVL